MKKEAKAVRMMVRNAFAVAESDLKYGNYPGEEVFAPEAVEVAKLLISINRVSILLRLADAATKREATRLADSVTYRALQMELDAAEDGIRVEKRWDRDFYEKVVNLYQKIVR